MQLVIVESPAKAKTIQKYLGGDYEVTASFGHVRDLPSKNGSVDPDNNFAMLWEVDDRAKKRIAEITQMVKKADRLFLATDPDREGEAISWHLQEILAKNKASSGKPVKRIVFNEITKGAIVEAMKHPRDVNQELVEAYLARRALDYLVGFTLSPVLWRKLPGSKSAGRVQSVALRLICEREQEIEQFIVEEYWTIDGHFFKANSKMLPARLKVLDGKKLEKFSLPNKDLTENAVKALQGLAYSVKKVDKKEVKRHPFPPFITSTLQQEASRKLGLSASNTMKVAQTLYERGLITYMRTDGVTLAGEAIAAARRYIGQEFGEKYVPNSPRVYKSKAKNAQEAHEAIRPTDLFRAPVQLSGDLDKQHLGLYDLIWKRTLACQMESAIMDTVAVDIASADDKHVFGANGSVIKFDGFLKLYIEDTDDDEDTEDENSKKLPEVVVGEALDLKKILPEQHFTQPPPRYSEASLVKKMEELGIGRPSTYASILQVLKDREYVRLEAKRFIPEDRGRIVTSFLESFFERYVQYGFTADLEEKLDDIADGKINWQAVLRAFWQDFNAAIQGTNDLKITDVIDELNKKLERLLFPDGSNQCRACSTGKLGLKLSKFGAFIGCNNYPECKFTRPLGAGTVPSGEMTANGDRLLGVDKEGREIVVKKGPYGFYVQAGEPPEGEKPRRASLTKGLKPETITFEQAEKLLILPRDVGIYADTGQMIIANIGMFGAYLKMGETFANLGKEDDVYTVGLNRATDLIATSIIKNKERTTVLGLHPKDGAEVKAFKSRFGYMIIHNKTKIAAPKNFDPANATLEQALEMLVFAKPPKKKAGARKTAAKKPAAKKKVVKK